MRKSILSKWWVTLVIPLIMFGVFSNYTFGEEEYDTEVDFFDLNLVQNGQSIYDMTIGNLDKTVTLSGSIHTPIPSGDIPDKLDVGFNVVVNGSPLVIKTDSKNIVEYRGYPEYVEYTFSKTFVWDYLFDTLENPEPLSRVYLEVISIDNVDEDFKVKLTNVYSGVEITDAIGTKLVDMKIVEPKDIYTAKDSIIIDMEFTDEVWIDSYEESHKLGLVAHNGASDIKVDSISKTNGNNLRFTYKLDEDSVSYKGTLRMRDLNQFRDMIDEVLWAEGMDSHTIKDPLTDNDIFRIESVKPSFTGVAFSNTLAESFTFYDDKFYDSDLNQCGEIMFKFTSEEKSVEEIEQLDYERYNDNEPLDIIGYASGNYVDLNEYSYTFDLTDPRFDESKGLDQKWYLYVKLVDIDGNDTYFTCLNRKLDRLQPEMTLDEVDFMNNPAPSFSLEFNTSDRNLTNTQVVLWEYDSFINRHMGVPYDSKYMSAVTIYESMRGGPIEFASKPHDILTSQVYDGIPRFVEDNQSVNGNFKGKINVNYDYNYNADINKPDDVEGYIKDGVYVLEVIANDMISDNDKTTEIRYLWIDKRTPIIGNITETEVNGNVTEINVEVSDYIPITEGLIGLNDAPPIYVDYEFWFYGETFEYMSYSGTAESVDGVCHVKIPHGEVESGSHTLYMNVRDLAGNESWIDYDDNIISVLGSKAVINSDTEFDVTRIYTNDEGDTPKHYFVLDYTLLDLLIEPEDLSDLEMRYINLTHETSNIQDVPWDDTPDLKVSDGGIICGLDLEFEEEADYVIAFEFRYLVNGEWWYLPVTAREYRLDNTPPVAEFEYPDAVERGTDSINLRLWNWYDPIDGDSRGEKVELEILLNDPDTYINIEDVEHVFNITANGFYHPVILTDKVGNVYKPTVEIKCFIETAEPVDVVQEPVTPTQGSVTVQLVYKDILPKKVANKIKIIGAENYTDEIAIIGLDTSEPYFEIFENGTYTIEYEDDYGEKGRKMLNIHTIDDTDPEYEVSYSTQKFDANDNIINVPSKENIIAYIDVNEGCIYDVFDENGLKRSGELDKAGKFEIEFSGNYTQSFIIRDFAGNEIDEVSLTVDWFDDIKPTAELKYSDNYHKDEYATEPIVIEVINIEEGAKVSNNGGKTSKTFSSNQEYTFIVEDEAHNKLELDVVIDHFEVMPEFEITYSHVDLTNEDVSATLELQPGFSFDESMDGDTLVFTQNGTKVFTLLSDKGKYYYIKITIDYIDKVAPVLVLDGYRDFYTAKGKPITITDDFTIIDNVDMEITEFEKTDNINWGVPGIYTVTYSFEDKAGNDVIYTRNVEVISDDDLCLLVDGQRFDGEVLYITGDTVTLDPINTQGEFMILHKYESRKKGYFKSNGNDTQSYIVDIKDRSIVTFIILDQERRYELVKCMVVDSVSGR